MKQSFITWQGWKSTFGRWNLWIIVAIHAVCGYGFAVADHWAGYAFAGAVILAVWIGGYIDWRALLKIDHAHPNAHTLEVCEECDPIQMRDGGPVTNIVWWYAADNKITRKLAQDIFDDMSALSREQVEDKHDAYLALDKFRNYPRP